MARYRSVEAARFIAKWEGFLPSATLDTIAVPPVWTIGYGHTGHVTAGMHWSRLKALKVLSKDIKRAERAVDREVRHVLTARQKIALVSFTFNLGPNIWAEAHELRRFCNEGRWDEAAHELKQYDHAGGVVVEGLRRRRHAEAWMLVHGTKAPHTPKHTRHRPDPRKRG